MRFVTTLVLAVALVFAVTPAVAGKGGNGNGRNPVFEASCTASGTVVSASGLPVGDVINFLITDARGSAGWVLGFTDDGSWNVAVPPPSGETTYEFVSRTWGPDGSKYDVYASCSQ